MKNILVVLTLPDAVREHYARELRAAFPGMRFDVVDHASKAGPYLDTADAVIAFGVMLSDEIFAKGKNIGWVQAMGSGVDGIVDIPPDARLPGSLALALHAAAQGVQLVRVHDVPETVQAPAVWRAAQPRW